MSTCHYLREDMSLVYMKQGDQIEESVLIWASVVPPFDDFSRSGWTITEYSVKNALVILEKRRMWGQRYSITSHSSVTSEDVSRDVRYSCEILTWLSPSTQSENPHLWAMGAFSFYRQTPLVVIRSTLTAQPYVDDILRLIVLPFLSWHPDLHFNSIMLSWVQ